MGPLHTGSVYERSGVYVPRHRLRYVRNRIRTSFDLIIITVRGSPWLGLVDPCDEDNVGEASRGKTVST